MEWPLFAVVQLFITTIAVGVAFWLRIRAVNQQNALLRAELASTEATPAPDFEALIAALDADSPTAPMVKLVLAECAAPSDDFEERLRATLADSPFAGDAAALEAAQAEIETLKRQVEEGGQNEGDELKTLLMQFTNDSREMMACIQDLEAENAQMRQQLGIEDTAGAGDAAPSDDAETRDSNEVDTADDTDSTENAA